jgi:hypothetical protein
MQGNRLVWTFPQPGGKAKVVSAVFRLGLQPNPRHFDWYTEDQPHDVHKRLYLLEGNTLIWSTNLGNEARLESFIAGRWQFVMKRVKQECHGHPSH